MFDFDCERHNHSGTANNKPFQPHLPLPSYHSSHSFDTFSMTEDDRRSVVQTAHTFTFLQLPVSFDCTFSSSAFPTRNTLLRPSSTFAHSSLLIVCCTFRHLPAFRLLSLSVINDDLLLLSHLLTFGLQSSWVRFRLPSLNSISSQINHDFISPPPPSSSVSPLHLLDRISYHISIESHLFRASFALFALSRSDIVCVQLNCQLIFIGRYLLLYFSFFSFGRSDKSPRERERELDASISHSVARFIRLRSTSPRLDSSFRSVFRTQTPTVLSRLSWALFLLRFAIPHVLTSHSPLFSSSITFSVKLASICDLPFAHPRLVIVRLRLFCVSSIVFHLILALSLSLFLRFTSSTYDFPLQIFLFVLRSIFNPLFVLLIQFGLSLLGDASFALSQVSRYLPFTFAFALLLLLLLLRPTSLHVLSTYQTSFRIANYEIKRQTVGECKHTTPFA
jgi:hypothetical protein